LADQKTRNGDGKPAENKPGEARPGAAAPGAPRDQKISFDTSDLKSSYCNVCNATSTREEVVLNFGINHTWDRDQADVSVKLQHRIIISPHAAKRFQNLMTKLITEHEARYGKLD
jgi:hypothetical protein